MLLWTAHVLSSWFNAPLLFLFRCHFWWLRQPVKKSEPVWVFFQRISFWPFVGHKDELTRPVFTSSWIWMNTTVLNASPSHEFWYFVLSWRCMFERNLAAAILVLCRLLDSPAQEFYWFEPPTCNHCPWAVFSSFSIATQETSEILAAQGVL